MREVWGRVMLREQDALLLPCPLLDGKTKVIEGYYCDGSKCPQWTRSKFNDAKGRPLGSCYWIERVREHETKKEKSND